MDENMTVPRELMGAMMKRLQHLEEGIGRIYMVHRKTGCTDCDHGLTVRYAHSGVRKQR